MVSSLAKHNKKAPPGRLASRKSKKDAKMSEKFTFSDKLWCTIRDSNPGHPD